MGYTHYWRREKEIPEGSFTRIVNDFKKLIPVFERNGVRLAGGFGEGEPRIDDQEVWFNGLERCGHEQKDLGITWPVHGAGGVGPAVVAGSWFAGARLQTRSCGGDCSHETLYFPRILKDTHQIADKGKWFNFCKTAFKPYDIAVNAFLIVAKHHLGKSIDISSDGQAEHWFDAMLVCQIELGYGMEFRLE